MREFLTYVVTKYTVSLYLLSAGSFLLPILVQAIGLPEVPSGVFNIFGTGIFITTLVSSILNFYFQEEVKRHFSIISGAEKSRIVRIYSSRSAAMCEINTEFQKARGNVELLSIAGTNFFAPDCDVLKELDRMCENNSNVKVRVLLLDPRSKHAVDRTLLEEDIDISKEDIEEIDYTNKKLCEDILLSLRQLEGILEDRERENKTNFELAIRTYDTAPIMLFAQVNGRMFTEQYHYGISEEDRKTKLTKCIGKKVPVIEFESNSLPSQLWESHFNYLWETSSRREVFVGFARWLRNALQQENTWIKVYSESKDVSEKYLAVIRSGVSDKTA